MAPVTPLTQREIDILDTITQRYLRGEAFSLEQNPHYRYIRTPIIKNFITLDSDPSDYAVEKDFNVLMEKSALVSFSHKEVGDLFRFFEEDETLVPVQYLLEIPNRRDIMPAQLTEIESLLNKVGKTLGVDIPPIPQPAQEDLEKTLLELARIVLLDSPEKYHAQFMDLIASKGFSADMKQEDFTEFIKVYFA